VRFIPGRAAAEQQFVGVKFLLAIEDRLAADEDVAAAHVW
jgi:hypothetical protein